MKYKYKMAWDLPTGYKFDLWCFDFNHYGVMTYLRLFGLLIQRYRVYEEKTVVHPITGSRWTI